MTRTIDSSQELSVTGVGSSSVLRVIEWQLEKSALEFKEATLSSAQASDVLVVAAGVGDERFTDAATVAHEHESVYIPIELGGIGGHPLERVHATVSFLTSAGPCYHCLRQRVESGQPQEGVSSQYPHGIEEVAGAIAGQRLLSNEYSPETTQLGTCIELPYRERTVLPIPGCPYCETEERDRIQGIEEWSDETRTLEEATAAGERAVDERLGPITQIGEFSSMPLPYYLATLVDTATFSDQTAAQQAAGVAPDWEVAFMKALGEALERYAAGVYRTERHHSAPIESLEHIIDPRDVVRPADSDSVPETIEWIQGLSLCENRPIWIPAELVTFPPPTRDIRPAITTGLGLGNSMAEATIAGLVEVIERDAMMLSWYATGKPLAVRIEDDAYDDLLRRAAFKELSVSTVLLTQDVDIPVIGVAVHRDDGWPQLAMGSAASLDATAAARGALQEALQNWIELDSMGEAQATNEAGRIASYAADPDPVMDFLSPMASVSAESISHSDPAHSRDELVQLIDIVTQAGWSPAVARTTTSDIQRLGFEAVRVVEPSAQPLFTGEAYFGERARTVPKAFGEEPWLDRQPHPFP